MVHAVGRSCREIDDALHALRPHLLEGDRLARLVLRQEPFGFLGLGYDVVEVALRAVVAQVAEQVDTAQLGVAQMERRQPVGDRQQHDDEEGEKKRPVCVVFHLLI